MSIQAISTQATGVTTAGAGAQSAGTTKAGATTQAAGGSSTSGTTQAASPTASYTVNISKAAHAALAEASETSVQTAQEAGHGDQQAQRLLAREQASKAG